MAEVTPLRVPPHSVAAEQAVLGALLIDGNAWPLVARILDAADFHRLDHRLLYAAMARLAERSEAIDTVTLTAELERRGELAEVGGAARLIGLVRETATAETVEHYARAVRERAQLRRLGEFAASTEARVYGETGESAETLIAEATRQLTALQGGMGAEGGLIGIEVIAQRLLDDLDARKEGHIGLSVGLPDFDGLTGGLEPGELTLLAGRPGIGKTALMVTIAAHVSRDAWVGIFSAEMPALQIGRRLLAMLGGPRQDQLRRPERMTEADWELVTEAMARLGERHIAIDDKQLPSLEHVRAECIGYKARWGMGLVLIDYAQLLSARGANRYEQLREVSYGAKALAKELNCPVVMLAQLNRGVEQRDDKRPRLSDLRDSGSLEEAADIVGLLYREGYYNDTFDMPFAVECNLEKHRNGERGQCLWHFAGEYSRMTSLDESGRALYRNLIRSRKGAAND